LNLNIAFNYGGRDEIIYAVQNIIRAGVSADDVTIEMMSALPLHRRNPRPGPDHPHIGRTAHQQLPDLAKRLCRVVHHPDLLARL
jgi:hypothetical protein